MATSLGEVWRGSGSRQRLKLLVILAIPTAIIGTVIWFIFLAPMQRQDHLVRNGMRLRATILKAHDRGGKNRRFDLTLAIQRPGGSIDTVETVHNPLHDDIPLLRPGTPVSVAVDSTDPDDVLVFAITDRYDVKVQLPDSVVERAIIDTLNRGTTIGGKRIRIIRPE